MRNFTSRWTRAGVSRWTLMIHFFVGTVGCLPEGPALKHEIQKLSTSLTMERRLQLSECLIPGF